MNPGVITLDALRKVFPAPGGGDPVVALDGIDLHLEPGRIHGIVGRSGAGKSTLIRCLTGLEKPTSGRVEVDGTDIAALEGAALGLLGLDLRLHPQALSPAAPPRSGPAPAG